MFTSVDLSGSGHSRLVTTWTLLIPLIFFQDRIFYIICYSLSETWQCTLGLTYYSVFKFVFFCLLLLDNENELTQRISITDQYFKHFLLCRRRIYRSSLRHMLYNIYDFCNFLILKNFIRVIFFFSYTFAVKLKMCWRFSNLAVHEWRSVDEVEHATIWL